jgi:VCBS repeat-containing protein
VQTTTGTLSITDVDSATTFVAQTATAGSNGYGKFSLTAVGVWTYTMDTAHDEFVAGVNYTDSFTATSADGTTKQITVTINGTNDAPVVVTPDNAITTQEDTSVTFVIADQLADKVTDAEGTSLKGIVIVQNLSSSGTWAYSTDGVTWVDFPSTYLNTVAWNKVMYLNASDSLRYTPAANANGADLSQLNFRAVDVTYPDTASGTQVNVVGLIGGAQAVSNQPGFFTVSVDAVNDRPTFTSTSPIALSGSEDTPYSFVVADALVVRSVMLMQALASKALPSAGTNHHQRPVCGLGALTEPHGPICQLTSVPIIRPVRCI